MRWGVYLVCLSLIGNLSAVKQGDQMRVGKEVMGKAGSWIAELAQKLLNPMGFLFIVSSVTGSLLLLLLRNVKTAICCFVFSSDEYLVKIWRQFPL